MNEFKEKLSGLSKEEKQILLSTIKENGEEYNVYPLSFEQSRMWYLYNLDNKNPYYNVSFMITLYGGINLQVIEKVLKTIMIKQRILNSKIVFFEGEAFQYILDNPCVELSLESIYSKDIAIDRIKQNHNKPFDLENEIPIRFNLYCYNTDKYILSICVHHMYIDGWSMALFYNEFKNLYVNYSREYNYNAQINQVQYYDYIKKQLENNYDCQKKYWKEKLKDASFNLNLPYSYPRELNENTKSGYKNHFIYNKKQIEKICKELKISVFSFFLSIYYLTLNKCCKQDNITVGAPVLNRNSQDLSTVIGFFSNSIPINIKLDKSEKIVDFFKKVNHYVLESLDNSDLPFNDIVNLVNAKSNFQNNPIFQTVFSFHNNKLICENIEEEVLDVVMSLNSLQDTDNVQFDLLCTIIEEKEKYKLSFDYKEALFSEDRIQNIVNIYEALVKEILDNEQSTIDFYLNKKELILYKDETLNLQLEKYKDIIMKNNNDIIFCDLQFYKSIMTVYYISNKNIDNNYFVEQLQKYISSYVVSLKLNSLPLNSSGELAIANLSNKFEVFHDNTIKVIDKFKTNYPNIEMSIEYYKDECRDNYYKIKDLIDVESLTEFSNKGFENVKSSVSSVSNELSLLLGDDIKEYPYKTLAQVLLCLEEENKNKNITTINFNNIRNNFSYQQLLDNAKNVANNLKQYGLKKSDKVILEINNLDEFVKVFWGCILAGATIIPLDIPKDYKFEKTSSFTNRFINIYNLTEKPLIIADSILKKEIDALDCINSNQVISSLSLLSVNSNMFEQVNIDESDIALILFTSGSTGIPKGVKLSHRNIIKRSQATILFNNFNNTEISLNWMPLSHVGGIVMFHILDVVNRSEQIQVETSEILQNPVKWLELLEEFKVTNTWAPNFAYGLILEQKDTVRKMNLSLEHLKFILNGGEAINFNACNEFMMLLADKKLRYSAMKPSWGMTETSSGVLFSDNFGKLIYRNSVSVGSPIAGVKARIIDENGKLVPKGEIGILQISGETINQGYYKNPKENEKTFTKDNWFDTGDFAIIKSDEIVITGRAKDIVIVNGVNVSCLEIEKDLEEIQEIQTGTVACTSIKNEETNRDEVCIFYGENNIAQRELLKEKISLRIMKNYGFTYEYLVPVKPNEIPRTSIGKIDKNKLLVALNQGELYSIAFQKSKYIPKWFAKSEFVRSEIIKCEVNKKDINIFAYNEDQSYVDDIIGILKKNDWNYNKLIFNEANFKVDFKNYNLYISSCEGNCDFNSILHEMDQIKSILNNASQDNNNFKIINLIVLLNKNCNYNSILQGYCSSLPLEYKNVHIKCVIIDKSKDKFDYILNEFSDMENLFRKISIVKYEEGKRYLEVLKKQDVLLDKNKKIFFESQKTYVVLGGLGGIGLSICDMLLKNYKCKLIIIGKTKLSDSPEKTARLKKMQEVGYIDYYDVDIKKRGQLKNVLDNIYRSHSNIKGIINLIGEEKSVVHFDEENRFLVRNLNSDDMKNIAAARFYSINDINEFLLDKNSIDVIAFSSVTAFFGGYTYSIYSAISKYWFDYEFQNNKNNYYVFAWSKWDSIGMSEGESMNEKLATEKAGYNVLDIKSGLCSLNALLARNIKKSIIGLDLDNQFLSSYRNIEENIDNIKTNIFYDLNKKIEDIQDENITFIKKEDYVKDLSETITETELVILKIWQKVLGNYDIKINDKFFNVGGNSLKSIKLISEINDALGCELSIMDLFRYSSVKEIADYLNNNNYLNQDDVVIVNI